MLLDATKDGDCTANNREDETGVLEGKCHRHDDRQQMTDDDDDNDDDGGGGGGGR